MDMKSIKVVWLIALGNDGNRRLLTTDNMDESCPAAGLFPAGVPWATGPSTTAGPSTAGFWWCAGPATPAGSSSSSAGPSLADCWLAGSATSSGSSMMSGSSGIHDHDGSPCWPFTCWPVICWAVICRAVTCWAVTCWAVHSLCRTRHSCWVIHFSCRLFNVFWLGRQRNHRDGSSLWWLGNGWGQLYLPSGRRMNQTSQHFHVFGLDDDQADTCYLLTPSMMMKTGTYDHPMTCDDGDGNERKTLKAGHPSPSKWHGSTPDHPWNQPASWSWTHPIDDVGRARSLSTSTVVSRRMMGRWGVLASVGPMRSSIGLPTSWSVAFRLIDTLKATDFLGSQDLEGLLADCSTSVAFDLEPVAVLALFVLDDPSLLRLVGSWRTSSGVCISTESSIVSRSWDFFAAFAALHLRFCSLAFSWACQASGSQSLQISQGESSVHKVRPSFRRDCWQR